MLLHLRSYSSYTLAAAIWQCPSQCPWVLYVAQFTDSLSLSAIHSEEKPQENPRKTRSNPPQDHPHWLPFSCLSLPCRLPSYTELIISTSTAANSDCCALHQNFLVSFPRIPFPETIELRIRGFFHARKNSCKTRRYDVKCRKALWLRAREALWSNCKRTQSSKSRFFLCKKSEQLLRSLRGNYDFLESDWSIINRTLIIGQFNKKFELNSNRPIKSLKIVLGNCNTYDYLVMRLVGL